MVELLATIVIFIGLAIGSYTDFKVREVPDWLNFSMISLGFAISLLSSIIYSDITPILSSTIGFIICLAIALMMFYTGQWGGGDSKMIMALGALIGLNIFKIEYIKFSLISLIINILLVGAIYGLAWSIFLAIKNRKMFAKEIKRVFVKRKAISILLAVSLVPLIILIMLATNFLVAMLILMLFMLIILYFMWYFVKAIEKVCMIKLVTPDKLTEGDWIAKDIKIDDKLITGPKDLGISKKQINLLLRYYKQKKIKNVLIKEGIPFIPSFLIAYILTLIFGNMLFLLF